VQHPRHAYHTDAAAYKAQTPYVANASVTTHSAYMDSLVLVGVRTALNIRPKTLAAAQTRKATL